MPAVATRYVTWVPNRPRVQFGVRIDRTNPAPSTCITERLKIDEYGVYTDDETTNTTGMYVDTTTSPHVSTFDSYYPWAGMQRCIMWYTGDVAYVRGDIDEFGNALYTEAGATNTIMVRVPKFWYKYVYGATYNEYWVSPFPLDGYRLHPAFWRQQKEVDCIYVGAMEAYINGGFVRSGPNITPTTSTTRATFRTDAAALGPGYRSMDVQAYNALQWLYLIEYACKDCQSPSGSAVRGGLSAGVTNSTIQKTGWTTSVTNDDESGSYVHVDLGNASGQVQVAAGVYAMSYRGVENLYGNTFTMLDGNYIAATTGALYINYNWTLESDDVPTAGAFQKTGLTAPTTDGTIQTMAQSAGYHEPEWLIWPATTTTTSGYWMDKYTHPNLAANRFIMAGGYYGSGVDGGIFSYNLTSGFADNGATMGSRLMFAPTADMIKAAWYYY